MLTSDRIAALTAVANGTVKRKARNAPGSQRYFEPRELTVALGFWEKAACLSEEYGTVELTERGRRALAATQA